MATVLGHTTALRQRMHQDLQLAGLSERTQEAYLRAVRQLADHFHTPPDRLSEQQVREHLRALHFSIHIEDAYVHYISRFILFHLQAPPTRDG